jgi:nicotinate-nucleotide pyrophosphorylase (carboxylating)
MISGVTMKILMDDYIRRALAEDITSEDVSTNAVMPEARQGSVELICKQDGVLAGLQVFARVFELLDENARFESEYKDGDEVKAGQLIGVVYADIRTLLSGERTALNYLQRMCGIATLTRQMVRALQGSRTRLLDTRKTTPNMRPFEKYAVQVGGACSHRYNLSDGVLLKDNHIDAAGGVRRAVEMAKAYAPFVRKIEVEVENMEMVREAVEAGADIIMLDNMDNAAMEQAVKFIDGRAETECSGNVTLTRLEEIGKIGVDYVSCGALTHSAPIMDISMKHLRRLD